MPEDDAAAYELSPPSVPDAPARRAPTVAGPIAGPSKPKAGEGRPITLELEPGQGDFQPSADVRSRIPEPLPVKLVAVADVRMLAAEADEAPLETFYVGLLQLAREGPAGFPFVYRAENFRIYFDPVDRLARNDDLRPLGIEVRSLATLRAALVDREIEHEYQRGLVVGQESILVRDPAGNWLTIVEAKPVR